MKIVSLLASGTEIVCALGLEHALVGISHECDHPPEVLDRPRVSRPRFDPEGMPSRAIDRAVREAVSDEGSVYEIDVEQLEEISPHLILTQAVCEVCAVPTDQARVAVEQTGLGARILSLDAHSLRDILDSLRLVGEATGTEGSAEVQVAELRRRMHAVSRAVAGATRPRVLALEWLDPLYTPGHWVPEMIDMAGGECLAGAAKERSMEAPADELAGLDPDVLLIMPCGYGLAPARRDANEHVDLLRSIAPRAIEAGRAFVLNGSAYFNRSGPRVVEGVEALAGLLHPELWRLPAAGAAATWRPEADRLPAETTAARLTVEDHLANVDNAG